jgi:hypothetical protein
MQGALLAIAFMTLIGVPIALGVDRSARGPLLIGTAFLYASGWMFFALLAMSLLHVQWTVATITIAGLLALVVLFFSRHSAPGTRHSVRMHPLDLLTLITVAGFTIFATIWQLWEWDFWAIWGIKARAFWEIRGIDWTFLETQWNAFAHLDYPLLVPLNLDVATIFNGVWDDKWIGLMYVAWAVALVLVVRDLASREAPPVAAAIVTFVATTIAASRWVGLAEGPMIAFGSAGVLFARNGLRSDSPTDWRHAAILLGLAANVKNEGVALLVAVVVALLLLRRFRAVLRLWPALAIAAPWLIVRATHHLTTDIFSAGVANQPTVARVLLHVPRAFEIAAMLGWLVNDPWLWIALLAGILIVPGSVRREAFVFLVTAIQLTFYIGTYFSTPHDVRWHIRTSWPRLTEQIALPVAYVVVLMLWDYVALHSVDCQAPAASSRTPASS